MTVSSHQDFTFWRRGDGRPVTVAPGDVAFLDAVTRSDDPLHRGPGSYRGLPPGTADSGEGRDAVLPGPPAHRTEPEALSGAAPGRGSVAPFGAPDLAPLFRG